MLIQLTASLQLFFVVARKLIYYFNNNHACAITLVGSKNINSSIMRLVWRLSERVACYQRITFTLSCVYEYGIYSVYNEAGRGRHRRRRGMHEALRQPQTRTHVGDDDCIS